MGQPYTPDWYQTHKLACRAYQRRYHHRHPWMTIFAGIKDRCRNPKNKKYLYYGGQGIECRLTHRDLQMLWERDGAAQMQQASIDRLDAYGHYTLKNCRFIEHRENCARQVRVIKRAAKRYYAGPTAVSP